MKAESMAGRNVFYYFQHNPVSTSEQDGGAHETSIIQVYRYDITYVFSSFAQLI